MAATGTVTINIVGDADRFRGALGDAEAGLSTFESKMRAVGQRLTSLGKSMTLGVTLPIVGAFALATKAAADEQQEIAKLDRVLQNSAQFTDQQRESVEKQITAWQNATGVADGQLRPALSNLIVAGMGWDQAQRTMATAMDIATAKGLPLETVTKALARAYGGNMTALSRLGIVTKDAEGNALSFDQVMKNAADTMGGSAAAAADTAAGRMAILRARFADSVEELGNNLLPILEKVIGVIGGLVDKFNGLSQGQQQLVLVFAGIAAAVGPLLVMFGSLATAIAAIGLPVLAVGAAIGALIAIAVLLYVKWDEVWNAVAKHPALLLILLPLGAILIPIIALVGVIKLLQEHWDVIWPAIQAVAERVWGVLRVVFAALDAALGVVGDAAMWLKDRWDEAWPTIQSILEAAGDVIGWYLGMIQGALGFVADAAGFLRGVWGDVWPTIQGLISAAGDVVGFYLGMIQGALGAVGDAAGVMAWVAGAAFGGIQSAAQTMWDVMSVPLSLIRGAFDLILDAVGAVRRAINSLPDIPSIPGAGGGIPFVPGLAVGGPVSAGQMYLVGEQGPELFVANTSGSIIPNRDLAMATAGTPVGAAAGNNYSISVSVAPGGNPAEVGRAVVESIKQYERRAGSSWRN